MFAAIPAVLNLMEDDLKASGLYDILEMALPWGCGNILQCLDFATRGMFPQPGNQWDIPEGEFTDDVFMTATPRELIFDGIAPGILRFALFMYDLIKELVDTLPPDNGILPPDFVVPDLPPEVAGGRVALFLNATTDQGWAKINSGKYMLEKFNFFVELNGRS